MTADQPKPPWPVRCFLWATRRLYNEFAWAYDPVAWLVSVGRWEEWRRTALAHVKGRRVLEIGFGTGELLLEMAGRPWQVCGLDLSPAMQRQTRGKMRRRRVWAPCLRGNALALPFAAASFDTIVATFPADYILVPSTWQEAVRVLRPADPATGRPGGRLVIAGLFVESDFRLLDGVERFAHFRPGEDVLAHVRQMAGAHGFRMSVVREEVGRSRVPVIILEKE